VDLYDEVVAALLADEAVPANFWPFNYSSNVAEAQHLVKSGAALLFGFTVTNSNAAARFIQVFDKATAPANGDVPKFSIQVAATASTGAQWVPPRRMDSGIFICASTTQLTLTLGAAEFLFDVQYV